MRYVLVALAVVTGTLFLAPQASAEGCQGYNGSFIGTGTCDSAPYEDGSFDRCTSTSVFGFYNYQCVRIYP